MKTKYKYIHFQFRQISPNTAIWVCQSNKDDYVLGYCEWYPRWKQWQFVPGERSAFTQDCLCDIADFMNRLEKPK